jgi:hypothetical protein
MSLFRKLLEAVDSWRRRRGGPKTAKRAGVAIEHLDHRQLLSVNFTGNVPVDFPATQSPGVVVLPNNPNVTHPTIAPTLQPIVFNSGFDIQDIRVNYNPATDELNIGLDGPPAGPSTTNEVIAGDADNNGNSGTVNPQVTAVEPSFQDFPDFGGSEYMGAFLDLTGSGTPQVVAGFSENAPPATPTDPSPPKPYQVALATAVLPSFGTELPQFEGNVYTVNSPAHPNLEFSIKNFSQLYLDMTGQALTPNTIIDVGGMGGSANDSGIGEAFFPEQAVTIGAATIPTPTPTPTPPPLSPPILINPHEHRIIDTKHRDLVRVSVFGTSGFPVSSINPATVELDGVAPISHFTRKVQRDEFPFETFVFVANKLDLPAGLTTATLTGQTFSGASIQTSKDVLNIPKSARAFGQLKKYMGNASFYKSLAKFEARHPAAVISDSSTPVTAVSANPSPTGNAAIKVNYTPKLSAADNAAKAETVKVRPVVSIKRADASEATSSVPTRVRHSMEHFLS